MSVATRKTLTPTNTVQMQMSMMNKAQSLLDLTLVSGLAKPTVTRFIRDLEANKMVHVGSWARDARGYPTIKEYVWGKGVNAMCPRKNETSTVRMIALRAKRKATK